MSPSLSTHLTTLGFSKEMMPIECVYVWKEIYYKELFHVIMEADKSRDVPLSSGDPGERMAWWAYRPKPQEEPMLPEKPEGRKQTQCPSLKEVRQEDLSLLREASAFCSVPAFS